MVIHGPHHREIKVQTLPLLVLQKYFLLQRLKPYRMEKDGILHLKHRGTGFKIQIGFKPGMMIAYRYQKNMIL